MKYLTALIKPVSGCCNIDCKYCFYKALKKENEAISNNFISDATIETFFKKVFNEVEEELSICFQGGEPTLIGADFYYKIHNLIEKYNTKNIKVNLAIQTNGLLLDDKFIKILKEDNYLVGISLDGPKNLHDKYRTTFKKGGTFEQVIKAIELLKDNQVNFNILTVVSNSNVDYPEQIYSLYKSLKVDYVQLIECLDPLGEGSESNDYSLKAKKYGNFLCSLYDLWERDAYKNQIIHINYFENLIAILLKKKPSDCGMNGFCISQFVLESNGDVYPCDFYVKKEWKLGNINQDSISELYKSKTIMDFQELSYELDENCADCQYIKICRGGCRRTRENKNGLGKTFLCESTKHFLTKKLHKLIDFTKWFFSNR